MSEEATVFNMLADGEYVQSVYAHPNDLDRYARAFLIATWPMAIAPPKITFERVFDEDINDEEDSD